MGLPRSISLVYQRRGFLKCQVCFLNLEKDFVKPNYKLTVIIIFLSLLKPKYKKKFRIYFYTKIFFRKVVENAIRVWQHESGNILRFLDISPSINWTTLEPPKIRGRVAHIDIIFAKFDHNDGEKFDGRGGLVAHSAYPPNGIVHFDGSEKWSLDQKIDRIKEWDTKIHKDILLNSNIEADYNENVNLPYVNKKIFIKFAQFYLKFLGSST